MHLEYCLSGHESSFDVCGLAATAMALRMHVDVYMKLRKLDSLDDTTKHNLKCKAIIITTSCTTKTA
jgi:hypothetical protein